MRLEDQIFLLLINSKHGHLLLNRLPARFYRILCIFSLYARRPIGSHPPTKKCLQPPMVQWHCHVVSRYGRPYTSRECVAMRSCHCAAGVKQSGGLSSVCVLQSWHSPSFIQGRFTDTPLALMRPSLFSYNNNNTKNAAMKHPDTHTHTITEHILTEALLPSPTAEAWLPKYRGRLAYALWARLCVREWR